MNETERLDLLDRFSAGDRRTLSRFISIVENADPGAEPILETLFPRTGRAFRVGVTGPPGAGKSTLIDALVKRLRALGKRVGVVAVDPSSPFTGGALLGDRVRLSQSAPDDGFFFRSMATRGSLGGLAATASEVCDLYDAYGMDVAILETVGVGQIELDVVAASECTIVVLVPESGDDVQAMKAGLMEIGDVFVLNKSDREGADRAAREMRSGLELRAGAESAWKPPVIRVTAKDGSGVDELWEAVEKFREHQGRTGEGVNDVDACSARRFARRPSAGCGEDFGAGREARRSNRPRPKRSRRDGIRYEIAAELARRLGEPGPAGAPHEGGPR